MKRRWELLGSPVFLASIAALLLNDHVFKSAWPGLVTGKLSDVAGVVMVAIIGTAVSGRERLACGVTALTFAALKTVPVVAAWAAPILGGVTRTDPTDLIALLALVPLVRWLTPTGEPGTGHEPVAKPTVARRTALVVQIVATSAAVLATTATSCSEEGILAVVATDDGRIVARDVGFETKDGGLTWTDITGGLEPLDAGRRETCLPDGRCWQLRDGPDRSRLLVEVSATGAERVLLAVDLDARHELADLEQPGCAASPFAGVAAVDRSDGRHVVMAMGSYGTIHVGPDDRAEWVAVDGYGIQGNDAGDEPLGLPVRTAIDTRGFGFTLPGRVLGAMLVLSPVVLWVAMVPVARLARRRGRRGEAAVVALGLLGVATAIVAGFAWLGLVLGGASRRMTAFSIVFAAITVAIIVAMLWWQRRPNAHPPADELAPPDPSQRLG